MQKPNRTRLCPSQLFNILVHLFVKIINNLKPLKFNHFTKLILLSH